MSKKDLEILEDLYTQAKKGYLTKLKFEGKFITLDIAKRKIAAAKKVQG